MFQDHLYYKKEKSFFTFLTAMVTKSGHTNEKK